MDKVVHFEIPFDNQSRASKFYSEIFGWKLVPMPELDYVMAYAAETDEQHMVTEKGVINGGLFPRTMEAKSSIVVIGVASIDETVKKVVAAGGKLVSPKSPIPGGSYARVTDCEGNLIGIVDSSPS